MPKDKSGPKGKINLSKYRYEQGETITLIMKATDNDALKKITFTVKNTALKKPWVISGKEFKQKYSFSTKGWKPGTYYFNLLIEDKSKNLHNVRGNFKLNRPSLCTQIKPLQAKIAQKTDEYITLIENNQDRKNDMVAVLKELINMLEELKRIEDRCKSLTGIEKLNKTIKNIDDPLIKFRRELKYWLITDNQ